MSKDRLDLLPTKPLLLGIAHEKSSRLPDKHLRPFCGTTLFDIYLDKLVGLSKTGVFGDVRLALWPGDARLMARARGKIPIIERSFESAHAHNDLKTQFSFLEKLDCGWVVWPNCCAPFLAADTIRAIGALIGGRHAEGTTTAIEDRNWYFDLSGKPVNKHAASTQETEPLLKATYNVHAFRKDVLLRTGFYWEGVPRLWCLRDKRETLDIDYETEFLVAEQLWDKSAEPAREKK